MVRPGPPIVHDKNMSLFIQPVSTETGFFIT